MPRIIKIITIIGFLSVLVQLSSVVSEIWMIFSIPKLVDRNEPGIASSILGTIYPISFLAILIYACMGIPKRKASAWVLSIILCAWFLACFMIDSIGFVYLVISDPKTTEAEKTFANLLMMILYLLFSPFSFFLPAALLSLLSTKYARSWYKMTRHMVYRYTLISLLILLGWTWLSLLLTSYSLPPDVPKKESPVVLWALGLLFSLGFWASAIGIMRRIRQSIVAAVLSVSISIFAIICCLIFNNMSVIQRLDYSVISLGGIAGNGFAAAQMISNFPSIIGIGFIGFQALLALMIARNGIALVSKEAPLSPADSMEVVLATGGTEQLSSVPQPLWEMHAGLFALAVLLLHALFSFTAFYINWGPYILTTMIGFALIPISIILLAIMTIIRSRHLSAKQWVLRILLIAALASGVYLFGATDTFLKIADMGTKARLSSKLDLGHVQEWAVKLINEQKENSPELIDRGSKEPGNQYSDKVLPEIKKLEPAYLTISRREDGAKFLRMEWGGGFHHWGVFIGFPSFKPKPRESEQLTYWRDGIYGYQEK